MTKTSFHLIYSRQISREAQQLQGQGDFRISSKHLFPALLWLQLEKQHNGQGWQQPRSLTALLEAADKNLSVHKRPFIPQCTDEAASAGNAADIKAGTALLWWEVATTPRGTTAAPAALEAQQAHQSLHCRLHLNTGTHTWLQELLSLQPNWHMNTPA